MTHVPDLKTIALALNQRGQTWHRCEGLLRTYPLGSPSWRMALATAMDARARFYRAAAAAALVDPLGTLEAIETARVAVERLGPAWKDVTPTLIGGAA